MKKIVTTLLALSLILTLIAVPVTVSASAGSNMEKVLYYYKKGNYKKANTYNKKLSKYAEESCVKKMSSKMKKAYKKILKGYRLNGSGKCLSALYFSDIDNDKKAEMLALYGTSYQDTVLRVYKYTKGTAKKVGQIGIGRSDTFLAYPDHKGILQVGAYHGGEYVGTLTIKGNKIKETSIIGRQTGDRTAMSFRQKLRNYIKHTKKGAAYIDYSLLK